MNLIVIKEHYFWKADFVKIEVNEWLDISAINGKGYVMDEVLVPINMYTGYG